MKHQSRIPNTPAEAERFLWHALEHADLTVEAYTPHATRIIKKAIADCQAEQEESRFK